MTAPTFGPVVQVEPAGPAAAGSFARTSLGFILWVPQPEGAPAPSARGGAPASSGRKAPAPPPSDYVRRLRAAQGPKAPSAPLAGELYDEWPPAGMDGQP